MTGKPCLTGEDRVKLEWVAYAEEGHGFVNPANRADFWRRVENFLSRSIGSEALR